MAINVHTLQSSHWQIGILPRTGASIAFGRVRHSGLWLDIMRPTAEADYGNSSNTSSFIMLPWCNRIQHGLFQYKGQSYQVRVKPGTTTASHGDVRNRNWRVDSATETAIQLSFDSAWYEDINWPFKFTATAEYRVNGPDFMLNLSMKNVDTRPFPAGFGHHPYFVRTEGENTPQVEIPCDRYFELTNMIATGASEPIPQNVDFRELRPLGEQPLDHVLTDRQGDKPVRIVYPAWNVELQLTADDIFKHWLIYAPEGKPFYAVEPMTNVNDGFNLYAQHIEGTGVLELQPGEEASGTVRMMYQ